MTAPTVPVIGAVDFCGTEPNLIFASTIHFNFRLCCLERTNWLTSSFISVYDEVICSNWDGRTNEVLYQAFANTLFCLTSFNKSLLSNTVILNEICWAPIFNSKSGTFALFSNHLKTVFFHISIWLSEFDEILWIFMLFTILKIN